MLQQADLDQWRTGEPDTALRPTSKKTSPSLSVVHGAANASQETRETALSNQTAHAEGATDPGLLKRKNEGLSTEHIKAFLDAASEGDLKTLENLIQTGINVSTRGFEEIAPGPWTDAWGFESILENHGQYKLWYEPPPALTFCETGLHRAIIHKRTSAASFLLEQGADCSAKDSVFGAPALVWAAAVGSEALVRQLLQSGADVDAKNDDDRTAIHLAAKNGHTSVTQMLLNGMATPAARDGYGRTPLHWAASHGHFRIVRLLCSTEGVDIEARTKYGATPLHFAAESGKIGAVKMLLHNGADINAQVTTSGFTALHYAVHHSYRVENVQQELVSLLLDQGVDINAETDDGHTALYFARACDDRPMVKFLEQRGAKMDTKDRLASGALGAVDRLFKLF
jgi:ankyrin repeat protein